MTDRRDPPSPRLRRVSPVGAPAWARAEADRVTTYTYTLDDAVVGLTSTNAAVATPAVSYTYDPVYPRVTTMTDGTGTTSYTYHPAGQPGRGRWRASTGR